MKKKVVLLIAGVVLVAALIFLIYFFNRKFSVTFDFNNGMQERVSLVRYKRIVNKDDIKGKETAGELFLAWHEVTINEKGYRVISETPFDFTTRIKENINLIAVYKAAE